MNEQGQAQANGRKDALKSLDAAVVKLEAAETAVKQATDELSGDDHAEAQLLGEETTDVRTRVVALADRLRPA